MINSGICDGKLHHPEGSTENTNQRNICVCVCVCVYSQTKHYSDTRYVFICLY